MSGIVHTEDVWKIYGSKGAHLVEAVNNVTVEIEEGKVTAFGGPSGSGKSTLLSRIGFLTKPTRGKVFVDNEELSALSEVYRTRIRREKIGFIFQANYLIPQLTAIENVALPKICTDTTRRDAERIVREKLIALDMEDRLDFRVVELSGGEQQRVSIARALMNSPKILIADEPSSSIDEKLAGELLASLRRMTEEEGLTVIVATHDQLVLNWSDRVYTMKEGSVVYG